LDLVFSQPRMELDTLKLRIDAGKRGTLPLDCTSFHPKAVKGCHLGLVLAWHLRKVHGDTVLKGSKSIVEWAASVPSSNWFTAAGRDFGAWATDVLCYYKALPPPPPIQPALAPSHIPPLSLSSSEPPLAPQPLQPAPVPMPSVPPFTMTSPGMAGRDALDVAHLQQYSSNFGLLSEPATDHQTSRRLSNVAGPSMDSAHLWPVLVQQCSARDKAQGPTRDEGSQVSWAQGPSQSEGSQLSCQEEGYEGGLEDGGSQDSHTQLSGLLRIAKAKKPDGTS